MKLKTLPLDHVSVGTVGRWTSIDQFMPEESLPLVCCGFLGQPCSGTIEYDIFCARLDEDGEFKLLDSDKIVYISYWMYLPEAPLHGTTDYPLETFVIRN